MSLACRARNAVLAWGFLSTGACHTGARAAATPPPPPDARTVRFSRSLSLANVTWDVEIREARRGGPATGTMRVTTGDANRRSVERQFRCRARVKVRGQTLSIWTCAVPFRRGAPDWTAALARLDALGVMAPPPRDSAGRADGDSRPVYVCLDGTPWTLEVQTEGASPGVFDEQACGPISARRTAYEAGVKSVFDAIVAAGRAR